MKPAAYILYRVLWGLFRLLPLRLAFSLGWILGWFAWWLLPRYRHLAIRNVSIAFEGSMTPRAARGVAAAHFRLLGANLLSAPRLSSLDAAELTRVVKLDATMERLVAVQNSGRGVVALHAHLSNWEALALMGPIFCRPPIGAIYQRIGNDQIDAHVREIRQGRGVEMLERRSGIARALKILREGGVVGVLADQNAGDSGVWTPFFGRLTSTSPLPGLLAARAGAAIIPINVRTVGTARWVIEAGEAMDPDPDQARTAAVCNQMIERSIRVNPSDWFWVHDRWKTPVSNFLLSGSRKRVAFPPGFDMKDLKPFHVVIRSPNWLGDAVMSAPAVLAIKAGRPDLRLTIVAPENLRHMWEIVPGVDAIVVLPRRCGIGAAARLIRRAGRGDVAILFPNSLRSALEARRAGIRYLAGYKGHSRGWAMTKIIQPFRADHPPPHHIERYLRIAEKCGAKTSPGTGVPGLMIRRDAGHENGERPLLLLCPGAEYGPAKRWPADRFAAAAIEVSRRMDCQWRIVGLARERAIGERVAKEITQAGFDAENLCGKTSMRELINLLACADALLTNDTGTMHLATLVGTPVVAVFGPTEPSFSGPRGGAHRILHHHAPCAPCFLRKCPLDHRCMTSVEPGEAAEAVLAALKNRCDLPPWT